jgi:hypothetical protein
LAGLAALVNGMADPTCPKVVGDASHIKSTAFPGTTLVGAGGGNVSDTVYRSAIDFACKTVYITADLDMGGVYANGAWSGPNWTPIGGKYPMKPEVTKGDCLVLDTRFNGALDGQGHTVSNIYCNRYAEKGFPYSMAAGLVGFLGGTADNENALTKEFNDGWQPSVKNVVVGKGYIYARRMVGGVVGRVGQTSNGVVIENCANLADVRNTDSKGIGGVVGSGWGLGVVRNCYNAGSVTTTYACPAGGICGSNQGLSIYNCYNVGKIDSNGQKRGRGIGGHDAGAYVVAGCYYLEGCDDDPESGGWYKGTGTKISVDIQALSAAQMKSQDFISKLNASGGAYVADSGNVNGGYPVLYSQANPNGGGSFDVKLEQPGAGGTIAADRTGATAAGQTVSLTAKPDVGWALKHFTLNGKALDADFFAVSGPSAVGAVFTQLHKVKLILPVGADGYLSFSASGYGVAGDEAYAENRPVKNGDSVLNGAVVKVTAIPYDGFSPEDANLEYTGNYTVSATNAERNDDGTFTLTGGGDAAFAVKRDTAKKSWLTLADTGWYTGGQGAYTLTKAAQLAGMAHLVNVEGVDFHGVTISLGADISLANPDGSGGIRIWEACGKNASRRFSGTFDGRGYNIYDMTAYNNGSYAGLFGYCVGATIKNVTVRGTVTGESSMPYAAGIASFASGCVIENCVNRAEVKAAGTGAAGIAAYISDGTTVEKCVNRGAVSGASGVGGIVGICYSAEDAIRQCHNYGEINAVGDNSYGAGGIAGQLAGAMGGCGNFAAIKSADRYTGGLAGYTTSRVASKITDCASSGAVSASSASPTAAAGAAVGYAQYLTLDNVAASGAVSFGAAFASAHKGGLIGREGAVTRGAAANGAPLPTRADDGDRWAPPAAKPAPWTVTFMADGKTVGTATYSAAGQAVDAPAVPPKPGYTAAWEQHRLGGGDLAVRAAYRPRIIRAGDAVTEDGVYFLDPGPSGEITVAGGVAAILDGSLGACEGLSIAAGKGAGLTLRNVRLGGAKTLLTLDGGALVLEGESALVGVCDIKENQNPTLGVSGAVAMKGPGTLRVSADVGNAAVKLAPGASFELQGGALSIYKNGLLGAEGGAFYANEASVAISGGVFSGYANSDNVPVISAQSLKISGGTVQVQAAKSPMALVGKAVSISGGALYCSGHTGNSSSFQKSYDGLEAVSGLSGAAKCVVAKEPPFKDLFDAD